jgi:aromatic ring-opening dioxygenase catalytic subunit (LigB family)
MKADSKGIQAGTLGERDRRLDHGTLIPLYFLEKRYKDYLLVRVSISGLSFAEHYRLAGAYPRFRTSSAETPL